MIHTSVYQLVNPTMMVESEMKELKGSLKETSNLSYALLVIIIFTKVTPVCIEFLLGPFYDLGLV